MVAGERTRPEFGEVVKRLTDGLSLRGVGRKVGLSHSYVDDLRFGNIPSYRVLRQFAAGLELTPAELTELFGAAGYDPPADLLFVEVNLSDLRSGAEVLAAGLKRLEEQYQVPDLKLRFRGGLESLTPEQAQSVLIDLEEQLKEYQAEQTKPHADSED